MDLSNVLNMGGYAGYVLSCFALTTVVLIANVWLARRSLTEERVRAGRRASAG